MELADRVALVTGAGSGIGKASAVKLAGAGARVALVSDTPAEVEATAAEVRDQGGKALAFGGDVAEADDVARIVAETAERFGRLDIVLANAGINGVWAPLDELEPHEWDRTLAVNLRGTFLTCRYAVPHLKRAGGGAIVVVSSINGTRTFSNSGATAYGCSKAAQVAFTKMTALELAKDRIRVNAICPGRIETEINDNTWPRDLEHAREPVNYPAGTIPLTGDRSGSSHDVAELVLFLVSDRARHITGTPVWIDGAQSLLVG
jgi:NAD(P)-dependent dehydrogenase (short-subunit alcohol dehydrogenase family)